MNSINNDSPVVKCVIPQISDYNFSELTISEKLGGDLPTGHLSFIQAEDTDDLEVSEIDLNLVIQNEFDLSMRAYVDTAVNHRGDNQWDITLVPKKFYQEKRTNKFTGVNAMINSLAPYNLVNRAGSDCNLDGVDLYQNSITDYKYLTQYLRSLKYRQSFSYRFDGLFFSDFSNKPSQTIDISSFKRDLSIRVDRSKFEKMKVDMSDSTQNKIVNLQYNNSIISINKESSIAAKNFLMNQFLEESLPNKIGFEFPTYMGLRAGDIVKLTGNNFEENNYVVVVNTLKLTVGAVVNSIVFATV